MMESRSDHQAPEITLTSPLFEYAPGEVLPGIISLENAQLCNDAVNLGYAPLSVRMPAQQWAYGILIPINTSAIPDSIGTIAIKISMNVQHGEVGIAGVDESLSTLTTIERFVRSGQSTVTLTIADPRKTRAIFIRTTSLGLIRPELSVLVVAAHKLASLQLARRRHGLPFDLIVICAPPKTATQTVEQTIRSAHPLVQMRRLHYISEKKARERRSFVGANPLHRNSIISQAAEADHVRSEISQVHSLGGSLAIIVGTREPIDRAIAEMFQLLPDSMPFYLELYRAAGPTLIKLLNEVMLDNWRGQLAKNFESRPRNPFAAGINSLDNFCRFEFAPLTGMDILHQPIDREAGYTLVTSGGMSILIYRFEDIQRGLAAGLSALLGCPELALVTANVSSEKPYADLYREFRSSVRVPRELCEAVYRSRYVRHLYSESEIATFVSRIRTYDAG